MGAMLRLIRWLYKNDIRISVHMNLASTGQCIDPLCECRFSIDGNSDGNQHDHSVFSESEF